MSATGVIEGSSLKLRFSAPWNLDGHELFLKAKRLPEAQYQFDRPSDTYTVTSPARFAHLVGLAYQGVAGGDLALAEHLFDYQRFIVERALEAKRYAIWADCGLGKTPMALEWARHVSHVTGGGRVLFIVPKALIPQWLDEREKFCASEMVRLDNREEIEAWSIAHLDTPDSKFAITNFEKFIPGTIDTVRWCAGVVLDESSILKGGGGVIKWNLIKSCRGIEYKLSCTATPAPNDTIEYASQASFLEKLRNEGEILWTYFMRDPITQQWRVRPHARDAFYRFMAAWSIYIRRPSAYGFQDKFDLPEPELIETKLEMTPQQAREYQRFSHTQGNLLSDDRLGVTARSKLSQIAKGFIYDAAKQAKRIPSLKPALVAELVREFLDEKRQVLVWTVFDEESNIILERLNGVAGVAGLHGKDKDSQRELTLEEFRTGKIRCLVSKARLLGYGMNFQFCTRMIFSGFDDSFESFYQAVRRAHRYGATERLVVHVPFIPELESHMWNNLLRKRGQWESDIAEQEKNYVEALYGT